MASECVNSGLDIFASHGLQTSIEKGEWQEYRPLATLDDGPVEFLIKGGTDYLDLANTFLQIKAKVIKHNGDNLADADTVHVSTINLFLHSLFSEVDVYMNGVQVTSPSGLYAFKSLLQTKLSYPKHVLETQLAAAGYYEDTPGQFDDVSGANNAGMLSRKNRISESKVVDLIGRLHADIFQQPKYMLSHIDVRIKLTRSKDAFCLMSDPHAVNEQPKKYRVELVDAGLFVRKIQISPVIALAHAKTLEKANAKYPVTRTVCRVYSIAQNNLSFQEDNLFVDKLPNKLVIALVNQNAFNGNYQRNPYHFQHHDINYLSLYYGGQQIPSKALRPNFTTMEGVTRAYMSMFYATNTAWSDTSSGLTLEAFAGGNTLFCFDLSPSLAASADVVELNKSGPIRLEIQFGTQLPNAVNVLVYAEFSSEIQITKSRQVLTNFSA